MSFRYDKENLYKEFAEAKKKDIALSKLKDQDAKENDYFTNRIKFFRSSLETIFFKNFDIVVSNPPYIPNWQMKNLVDDVKLFEPKLALKGGIDGLDLIRKIIYKSKILLKKKGLLALEINNNQYKQ